MNQFKISNAVVLPVNGMLFHVSKGIQVEADGADQIDWDVEDGSEWDGKNLGYHQIAKRQERES